MYILAERGESCARGERCSTGLICEEGICKCIAYASDGTLTNCALDATVCEGGTYCLNNVCVCPPGTSLIHGSCSSPSSDYASLDGTGDHMNLAPGSVGSIFSSVGEVNSAQSSDFSPVGNVNGAPGEISSSFPITMRLARGPVMSNFGFSGDNNAVPALTHFFPGSSDTNSITHFSGYGDANSISGFARRSAFDGVSTMGGNPGFLSFGNSRMGKNWFFAYAKLLTMNSLHLLKYLVY
ncbi:unnamed protein product [Toxocara canis]|uniref:EB domain-containing protein n=1 Tax=Toxocara canis TaxID=6265 RepID=A0A183U7J2_TOXCA|nr:unnamed protein product [Toxocara canis]